MSAAGCPLEVAGRPWLLSLFPLGAAQMTPALKDQRGADDEDARRAMLREYKRRRAALP